MDGFFAMAVFIGVNSAGAANIAGTSFENEATGGEYIDTGNPAVNHDLINNAGQAPVDPTASSTAVGDLGFDASFVKTRIELAGMTDGTNVGVSNDTSGFVSSYADGSKGYFMRDTDGKMLVTFATVDLTGYINVNFSMQLFVNHVDWESADSIKITLALTDAANITLLDISGSDVDNYKIGGEWLTGSWRTLTPPTSIPDAATSATLIVALDSDGTTEAMCIDDIRFTGEVPEPASIVLMGLGALAAACRKK